MNAVQLDRETHELVDTFGGLLNKVLAGLVKKLRITGETESTILVRGQIRELERGLNEAEFLALLSEYLYGIERERRQLLLENDLLRDELNYISDKLKNADQRLVDLEELQRQEQFKSEIRTLDELLEQDYEFAIDEKVTSVVNDWYDETNVDDSLMTTMLDNDDAATALANTYQEITKVATTYFAHYLNDGQYEVVLPLCQRVIADLQSNNTDHRHELAVMFEILAIAHREDHQFAEAATMLKQTLTIYDQTLKADNPLIVTTLNNLAQLYGKCDRYADAEPLCRRALELRKVTSVGTGGVSVGQQKLAQQLNNMAIVCQNQRNYDTAADHYREALDIYEQSSSNELITADCVNETRKRLAGIYLRQKQFKKAELLYKDILTNATGPITTKNRPIWVVAEEVEELNRNKRHCGGGDSYHLYSDYQKWYENVKVKFPAVNVALKKLAFAYRKQGMHNAAKMLEHCSAIQGRKTMNVLDASDYESPVRSQPRRSGCSSPRTISTPGDFATPRMARSTKHRLLGSTSTPATLPSHTKWNSQSLDEDAESSSGESATQPKRIRL